MTSTPSENFLPIYENLVRERGDAITEAHLAAEHMHHQAVELLGAQHGQPPVLPADTWADSEAGEQRAWRGSPPTEYSG
ncbi:hypothetical protein [Streptomyces sp. NPDC046909]|uniref:hypothetical protein n=1 Tax=Streptomyces sp. NPDC046909 TaxID=3155617 RepID=UPI0033F6D4F3